MGAWTEKEAEVLTHVWLNLTLAGGGITQQERPFFLLVLGVLVNLCAGMGCEGANGRNLLDGESSSNRFCWEHKNIAASPIVVWGLPGRLCRY